MSWSILVSRKSLLCLALLAQGLWAGTMPMADSIDPTGLQMYLKANLGGVMGGKQSNSGLVTEYGEEATTSKSGIFVGTRYYFEPWIGLELESGYMGGSASATGTEPMDFTDAWSSYLGLSVIPWQGDIEQGLLQVVLSGGVNYTRLAFADEYIDFVEENVSGLQFYDDVATGLGGYGGADCRLLRSNGVMVEMGLRFLQENPKFPKGTVAFDAANLFFDVGFGYKF